MNYIEHFVKHFLVKKMCFLNYVSNFKSRRGPTNPAKTSVLHLTYQKFRVMYIYFMTDVWCSTHPMRVKTTDYGATKVAHVNAHV